MATLLRREQVRNIWYKSSSDPRDLSEGVMDSDLPLTILVTVHNTLYPITEDILHLVFDPYGTMEMIHILPARKHFQAALRFQNHNSVKSAKVGLHGRNIYDGCCRLDIQYLATSFWDAQSKKENEVVESIPSDICEIMQEICSTIDNLIFKLDKFRKSSTKKEVPQGEHQVFDHLPSKKFMEMTVEKVDSLEVESILVEEKQVNEEKLLHLDMKEVSKEIYKVFEEIHIEVCKGMETEMSGCHVFDKMFFPDMIAASFPVLNNMVMKEEPTKNTLGNSRDYILGGNLRFKSIMAFTLSCRGEEHGAGKNGENRNAEYWLPMGTGKSLIQRKFSVQTLFDKFSVQTLFDPGGYVVTWEMATPLNLLLNALGELILSWIHKNDFQKFGRSLSSTEAFELKKLLGKRYANNRIFFWKGISVYEVFNVSVFHTRWKYFCTAQFIISKRYATPILVKDSKENKWRTLDALDVGDILGDIHFEVKTH